MTRFVEDPIQAMFEEAHFDLVRSARLQQQIVALAQRADICDEPEAQAICRIAQEAEQHILEGVRTLGGLVPYKYGKFE